MSELTIREEKNKLIQICCKFLKDKKFAMLHHKIINKLLYVKIMYYK